MRCALSRLDGEEDTKESTVSLEDMDSNDKDSDVYNYTTRILSNSIVIRPC